MNMQTSIAYKVETRYAAKMRSLAKREGLTGTHWKDVGKNTVKSGEEVTAAIMRAEWHNATTTDISRLVTADLGRVVTPPTIAQRMRGILADEVWLAGSSNRGLEWCKV